mmetsp:Transcript_73909/g.238899  ORF Transcript_73909/g.238899 Transcript_73909/m.238899 type:complete len:304 (-) Transcript_73909:562-1473(-)
MTSKGLLPHPSLRKHPRHQATSHWPPSAWPHLAVRDPADELAELGPVDGVESNAVVAHALHPHQLLVRRRCRVEEVLDHGHRADVVLRGAQHEQRHVHAPQEVRGVEPHGLPAALRLAAEAAAPAELQAAPPWPQGRQEPAQRGPGARGHALEGPVAGHGRVQHQGVDLLGVQGRHVQRAERAEGPAHEQQGRRGRALQAVAGQQPRQGAEERVRVAAERRQRGLAGRPAEAAVVGEDRLQEPGLDELAHWRRCHPCRQLSIPSPIQQQGRLSRRCTLVQGLRQEHVADGRAIVGCVCAATGK